MNKLVELKMMMQLLGGEDPNKARVAQLKDLIKDLNTKKIGDLSDADWKKIKKEMGGDKDMLKTMLACGACGGGKASPACNLMKLKALGAGEGLDPAVLMMMMGCGK